MNILHKPGDKLPNGAVVIMIKTNYVLAIYRGEFVTWEYSHTGNTVRGNYFKSLHLALKNLYRRSDVIFSEFLEQ